MSISAASRATIAEFPEVLSGAELDAVSWRADSGIVPWWIWQRLNEEEKERVGRLRQEPAKALLRDKLLPDSYPTRT